MGDRSSKANGGKYGGGKRSEGNGTFGQDALGHKYTEQEYQDRLKELNQFSTYHYHATTVSAISGIRENGLVPSRGHLGEEVYMAKTEESAREWSESTSTGGMVVTRVKNTYLAKTDYSDYDKTKNGEGSTSMKIPTSEVQVKTADGKWINIKDAVVSYVNGKPRVVKRPKQK